jgi:hypothetical protein
LAKRKREKRTYKYECTLTGESYTLTEKAKNPEDLVSVEAWYEMHPEKDDRPEDIKKKVALAKTQEPPATDIQE